MTGRIIDVSGIPTYLEDCGDGEAVLLMHGSGPAITAAMSWDPVIPQIAAHRRVLSVDMPGYGRSAPLERPDTPENVAIHLEALLDELDIPRVAAVGHSRGGRIAVELAIRSPQRLSSLAVIGSGSVAPGGHVNEDGSFTAAAIALVNFGRDGNTSYERLRDAYNTQLYDEANLPDEVLRKAYEESVSSGTMAHFVAQMIENDPLNYYHKQDLAAFRAKLESIELDTLVVWGREDECSTYQRAMTLIDVLPNVEFVVLPQCGHFVMLDQPERFASIINGYLGSVGS